jgi:hypothetical protein
LGKPQILTPEKLSLIGLHHPLDGVTSPEYKLLHFIHLTKFFCKEKKAKTFNWDRCCHRALCLWLILFHYNDWIIEQVAWNKLSLLLILFYETLQLFTMMGFLYKTFLPPNHRHLRIIDCLTVHTACLVCFISTVNGHSKKRRKEGYYGLC